MRHKSTVPSLEYHNQFEGSAEDIKLQKQMLSDRETKEKKEGQSDYQIKKQTQKKG